MLKLTTSFRVRIILMTVAVSGAVLIAFGLASRQLFWKLKLENVDQSLVGVPVREMPHPEHKWMWERLEEHIERFGDRIFGGDVYLMSYGKDGERFFVSEGWPEAFAMTEFPEVIGDLVPLEERFRERFEDRPLPEDFLSRRRGGPDGERGRMIGMPRGREMPAPPEAFTAEAGGQRLRFAVYQFTGHNMVIGVNLFEVSDDVRRVQRAFFSALPFALAIVALGAWLISSGAIKPIRKLTETAGGMSAKRLSERIEKAGEDREFAELIDVFNDMLTRLDRSFQQANRFSADAAHELKTPLTVIQGQLEVALRSVEDGSEEQARFADLLSETQRLKTITRKLLLLAQADAGTLLVNKEVVNLRGMLEESIEDCEMQEPEIDFSMELKGALELESDRTLLSQIVQNLLGNAVKYNGGERRVEVKAIEEPESLDILFSNTGDAVPSGLEESLFERFTRGDAARNRKVDGFGLGLSLSREFARALGGELSYEGYEGDMNRFKLRLPLS
ncbi:MAG: ATP-binding protein [Verrucomicrobiota bacterium]